MATTTTITLKEFNLSKALSGAVLGFAIDGDITKGLGEYVLNFEKLSENNYVGYVNNTPYRFNPNGYCTDGIISHRLFIVEATIDITKGTEGTRAPGEEDDGKVDINVLQPREHFAIAALQGMLHNIKNPLSLDGASITLLTTKAFEIAQGMMSAAADARAEYKKPDDPEEEKKGEIVINPDDITSMGDKILYNIYVQNNNRAIDEKTRFDKLTGAVYEDKVLEEVKGIKIYNEESTPLVTKLHESSKIAEVVKVTEVAKVTEISGTADVNIASSDATLDTYVTNMPNVPTEPVEITGSVTITE